MTIKLESNGAKIDVYTPYNAAFVRMVKTIGGRWNANKKAWSVGEENEERLKKILTEIYGHAGEGEKAMTIKVRYKAWDFENKDGVVAIGSKETVKRLSRDRDVTFFNTVLVDGPMFYESGGSMRYPKVEAKEETVLESEIPQGVYDSLSDDEKAKIEIVEEKSEKEKLQARKAELLAELEKINNLLEQL